MSVFEASLDFLKEWEGIDSDHPADSGGRTRFGISQRAHPNVDVPNLTWDEAKAIYKRDYWDASGAHKAPPPVGFVLFDTAVNVGVIRAIRLLQRSVRVDDDGLFGPVTERAIDRAKHPALDLLAQRAMYYHGIMSRRQSQEVFGLGWMRRVTHAAAMAAKLEIPR